MRHIATIILCGSLAACGGDSKEAFEPGERATARTYEGYTAAEYGIDTEGGPLGDAKLFTRGVFRARVQGIERTVVHVGFEVENDTAREIRLDTDRLLLDSASVNREVVKDLTPARIDGRTTIAPGAQQRVEVYFALSTGTRPDDVDAFRIKWRLEQNGVTYAQRTPFIERADYYYYTPYYDPMYYDPYIFHPRVIVHRYPYRHYHIYR